MDLERNLKTLLDELWYKTYSPKPGFVFMISIPVKREVFASVFRDRVVQHLLFDFLEPLFEPTFIYDSYSCRKGKGTLFGIQRMESFVRSATENWTKKAWCLQIDISGYFMSIDKRILIRMIEDRTATTQASALLQGNEDFVNWLSRTLFGRDPLKDVHFISDISSWKGFPENKSMLNRPWWQGLPIGDLDSQLASNIYLGFQDQYVKRQLRLKRYGRYVDDSRGIDRDKAFLQDVLDSVTQYDRDHLGLTVHPLKSTITDVRDGVPFIGAHIMPFRTYCSDRTYSNMLSAAREMNNNCLIYENPYTLTQVRDRMNSYLGYLRNFREHRLMDKLTSGEGIRKRFNIAPDLSKIILKETKTGILTETTPNLMTPLQEISDWKAWEEMTRFDMLTKDIQN